MTEKFYCAALSILALFVASSSSAAEITVTKLDGDKTVFIELTGDIQPGDDDKFRNIAAQNPDAIVLLDSGGGTIMAAMEIGRIVRLRDYPTVVYSNGYCASACALIWVAGSRRVIFDGGRVGFHASYLDENGSKIETGVGNALVGHYLSQLGFGEKAVIFATSAPPDKLLWIDADNSKMAGINFEAMVSSSKANAKSADRPPPIEVTEATPPPMTNINTFPAVPQKYYAETKNNIRNVDAFASELKRRGYQADLDKSNKDSPTIITGANGHKIAISFSVCSESSCNYIELLSYYTLADRSMTDAVKQKWNSEEKFSGIYVADGGKSVALYHYIIVGSDGLTINNLIENIEYFAKDFDNLGSMLK